ncbi:MAG: (2Fe-2S)-binding protein [Elusimicrobia bacterium]|nr:(2Fe-2S)-binding protein [Elusimicrobiota bacterium]MBU2614449.1 (2Fe-2S)-binding protein [Elusimicrobiota bacterium]
MTNHKKFKLICRCEEITEEEIRKAVRNGADNIDAVKRITRAGMGLCQAKTCNKLVARIINEETGKPLSAIVPATIRPPIRPVPIKILGTKGEQE